MCPSACLHPESTICRLVNNVRCFLLVRSVTTCLCHCLSHFKHTRVLPQFSRHSGHRFPPGKLHKMRHSKRSFLHMSLGARRQPNGSQICRCLPVFPPIHTHFSPPRPSFLTPQVALDSIDQRAASCTSDVARGAGSGKCQLAIRHACVHRPGLRLADIFCARFVSDRRSITPTAEPVSRADRTGSMQP